LYKVSQDIVQNFSKVVQKKKETSASFYEKKRLLPEDNSLYNLEFQINTSVNFYRKIKS